MPNLTDKKNNFISETINAADLVMSGLERLQGLREDAITLGYTGQGEYGISDADFTGDNQHVDRNLLVALYGAANQLNSYMVSEGIVVDFERVRR